MRSLSDWANHYADLMWPVLPLIPRAKAPLTKKGLLDASVDPTQIKAWWSRWPNANIGLRTGVMFDVLDIDGDVGATSLERMAGPETSHSGPVSRTGRGFHWLYLPTGTANKAGLQPKLDWRGVNGYIVAPPSVHPDGHLYEWIQDPELELPAPPVWLTPHLSLYRPPSQKSDSIKIIVTNPYDHKAPSRNLIVDARRLAVSRVDIFDVATRMGMEPRNDGGGRWKVHCIFHEGDNEASMKLYPNNSFYCFGCHAWGSAVNLEQRRPGGRRER